MYEIPSHSNISKVVIDASVIMDHADPLLIYENTEQSRVASKD